MAKVLHNVSAYRAEARRRLPRPVFDFVDGGAEAEITLGANRASFDAVRFVPRVCVDVETRDCSTSVAGVPLAMPVVLAPTGLLGVVHPGGEAAAAAAAARRGTVAIVSAMSTYSLEEVAAAVRAEQTAGSPAPWFDLFPLRDRAQSADLIARAAEAGYGGLCVTLDGPRTGIREREIAGAWGTLPPPIRVLHLYARRPRWVLGLLRHRRCTLRNFDPAKPQLLTFMRAAAESARRAHESLSLTTSWEDVEWIRGQWRGPLAAKGAFGSADARRLADVGVDVLLLGNHGGRQLDGVRSSLEQLAAIRDAVDGVEIVLDGGVRRGTDVLKALSLGARACSIGRAAVYGLAVAGAAGVEAVLDVLARELDTAMTLLGVARVADLDFSYVAPAGISAIPAPKAGVAG